MSGKVIYRLKSSHSGAHREAPGEDTQMEAPGEDRRIRRSKLVRSRTMEILVIQAQQPGKLLMSGRTALARSCATYGKRPGSVLERETHARTRNRRDLPAQRPQRIQTPEPRPSVTRQSMPSKTAPKILKTGARSSTK